MSTAMTLGFSSDQLGLQSCLNKFSSGNAYSDAIQLVSFAEPYEVSRPVSRLHFLPNAVTLRIRMCPLVPFLVAQPWVGDSRGAKTATVC